MSFISLSVEEKQYLIDRYVGKTIRIISMNGEPNYFGREGVVRKVDDMGQLFGSWGGLAIIPGEDSFEIIS
jgi:hypothetical protein